MSLTLRTVPTSQRQNNKSRNKERIPIPIYVNGRVALFSFFGRHFSNSLMIHDAKEIHNLGSVTGYLIFMSIAPYDLISTPFSPLVLISIEKIYEKLETNQFLPQFQTGSAIMDA